ncbi:MAG: nickel-responsive transcriptional regulator NikR [Candidatus Marinimicrobia bacterium]|nr:nickel-responsive transcriptional regulator NikR [Candidatus Neomarinimicrobiota bacterium]MCF7829984.1 nickel-responsive transcriptional regulator NikR [Candidatus Neomarinimicrobiota bacterium]MCF7881862.1 nickel-responsive transcriptional regulator NikR [Candidatus Neomarinimicrobiota bacterium]
MPKIRFTVSLEKELLDEFDANIQRQNYSNRSEAIRDLIREQIVDEEWDRDQEVIGSITMVYNHHERESSRELTNIQHDHNDAIISTQHIHVDHVNCLEVVIVRGTAAQITELFTKLKSSPGVKQCELTRSTTGNLLS